MKTKLRDKAIFYLNGKRHEAGAEHASIMLSDFLRYEKRMTGTKVVCAEGDCGACSVLRVFPYSQNRDLFIPINSCVATVAQMDGSSLVTVDALADEDNLTPVQDAMVHSHGSQCGFCTPGFVIAMTGLVEKKLSASDKKPLESQEVKNALTGNLCRCTGYQPIIDAACSIKLSGCTPVSNRFQSKEQTAALKKALKTPLRIVGEKFSFYAPADEAEAVKFLKKNPAVRLIGATTDLGVVHNKGKIKLNELLSLHLIESLYQIKFTRTRVSVGARVTLSELREAVKEKIPQFAEFLNIFASPQIKNVATLIGNVCNASPVADTPPFLLITGARVNALGPRGKRTIAIEEFFLDYRKTALKSGELILSIDFEIPEKSESLALYKVSQRKDLDISVVNAAFRITWADEKRTKIKSARLAMGGVAAIPLRLNKTESVLKGKALTTEQFTEALSMLETEMNPLSDLRGSTLYRRLLTQNLFTRFFREHSSLAMPRHLPIAEKTP